LDTALAYLQYAATLLQAPLIYSCPEYGVWRRNGLVIFNALYILWALYLMHRRLLRASCCAGTIGHRATARAAAAVGSVWKWLVPFPTLSAEPAHLILVSVQRSSHRHRSTGDSTLATRWLTPLDDRVETIGTTELSPESQ